MQVEEVIHNSRLYSILIKERHGEKIEGEEELFFSPWSRNGFLSEIKTVQRQRCSIRRSDFVFPIYLTLLVAGGSSQKILAFLEAILRVLELFRVREC